MWVLIGAIIAGAIAMVAAVIIFGQEENGQ